MDKTNLTFAKIFLSNLRKFQQKTPHSLYGYVMRQLEENTRKIKITALKPKPQNPATIQNLLKIS